MTYPQIVMVAMLAFQFYWNARGDKSFIDFIATTTATSLWLGLLIWGGFFK